MEVLKLRTTLTSKYLNITACFNIYSGDVEDAPALDPLAKFEVVERDGAVYIKGEESAMKGYGGNLNIKCAAKNDQNVVIIGRYIAPLLV
jgi:hypothetical protein